jgi:hypothetical protein
VAKFAYAWAAESCFTQSGELFFSLSTALGSSDEPQVWLETTPVWGASQSALEELWQSSPCLASELAQACERQRGAQSGAISIASRAKMAMTR